MILEKLNTVAKKPQSYMEPKTALRITFFQGSWYRVFKDGTTNAEKLSSEQVADIFGNYQMEVIDHITPIL